MLMRKQPAVWIQKQFLANAIFVRSLKLLSVLAYYMLHEELLSDNGIDQSISEGLSKRKVAVALHEELLTLRGSRPCPGARLYSETWCIRVGLKTIHDNSPPPCFEGKIWNKNEKLLLFLESIETSAGKTSIKCISPSKQVSNKGYCCRFSNSRSS